MATGGASSPIKDRVDGPSTFSCWTTKNTALLARYSRIDLSKGVDLKNIPESYLQLIDFHHHLVKLHGCQTDKKLTEVSYRTSLPYCLLQSSIQERFQSRQDRSGELRSRCRAVPKSRLTHRRPPRRRVSRRRCRIRRRPPLRLTPN